MPKYSVLVPCTCSIVVEVNAENEKAAKLAAFEADFRVEVTGDADLHEFEMHEQIVRGNVFSGVANKIEVDQLSDNDDEDSLPTSEGG
jgi:hypothetical protein